MFVWNAGVIRNIALNVGGRNALNAVLQAGWKSARYILSRQGIGCFNDGSRVLKVKYET